MEYDVVVVGAGPAGLAAAIRLKQLDPERSVVVVEKGSVVGAHILSGAVIDPIGLNRLLPDWRDDPEQPLTTEVTEDRFYLLGPSGGVRLPNWPMPKLMNNHGNYIGSLGALDALARRRRPRRSASRSIPASRRRKCSTAKRARSSASPPATWASAATASPRTRFTRGMELRGKYTLIAEGARGSLAKQLIAKFALDAGRDPQKFGIGLKEVWQARTRRSSTRGWCSTASAGRSARGASGGSFLYHYGENLMAVGFVVHLNYTNPTLSPFDEFQRFKTHPMMRGMFEGAKRLSYGARAISSGGLQSVPKLVFPGGALIGCSAGFVNFARIKGSHNAILSGMQAAEAAHAALGEGRAHDELDGLRGRLARLATSAATSTACATSSRCGRASAWRSACRSAASTCGRNALFGGSLFGTMAHGKSDAESLKPIDEVKPHRSIPKPDGKLTFDKRLVGVSLQHQSRGGPAGASQLTDPVDPDPRQPAALRRARPALLPRRRLRGRLRRRGGQDRSALRHQRAELRPLQDLRHQGPLAEHHLGPARGRRRPELPGHVGAQTPSSAA